MLKSGTFLRSLTHHLGLTGILVLTALFFNIVLPRTASAWIWSSTGSLNTGRANIHTATLLDNGMVLVVGGRDFTDYPVAKAELYDPLKGIWDYTGSLEQERNRHTATRLNNGKVLVVGGEDYLKLRLGSAELYDPETGTWSATGSLNTPRSGHTAIRLANGKVLVVGGAATDPWTSSAELYDPESGTWTPTGFLNTLRSSHTATLLDDGRVLVVGGSSYSPPLLASAELYDPGTGTWSLTGSLETARSGHTAVLMADGKVIVSGGTTRSGILISWLSSAEIYDPEKGSWSTTGSLEIERSAHTLSLLPGGKVLATGGTHWTTYQDAIAITEIYDPKTEVWSLAAPLETARWGHTATPLPDGRILVAGGYHPYLLSLASAELCKPSPPPSKAMPAIPLLLFD
jgi:N-acetylneuraminic acid mutarotase